VSARKFFLASLALAVVALFLQAKGVGLGNRVALLKAQAVQRIADRGGTSLTPEERNELGAQTEGYRHWGAVLQLCGAATAFTCAGFLIASTAKREPAWRSLTLALLLFYALSFFIFV